MSKITTKHFKFKKIMSKHYTDAYVVPHHDENFSEYVNQTKKGLGFWLFWFWWYIITTTMNYTCLQI